MENNKQNFLKELKNYNIEYLLEENLAKYTTIRIGGNAEIFINITSTDNLLKVLKLIEKYNLKHLILGGGSNVLIHDDGIRGVVIKNSIAGINIKDKKVKSNNKISTTKARLDQLDKNNYYDFKNLDYDESQYPKIEVEIYSGTPLQFAINSLINSKITGLQWFAGIPGTIGGAVYNNIHGGTHFLYEYVDSVKVVSKGKIVKIKAKDLKADYDYTTLQERNDFILSATFHLYLGNSELAKKTFLTWTQDKHNKQPFNSAGCCFKNLSEKEKLKYNLESSSWGYIIDKKLNLKGFKIGGASISNLHAAFIINDGQATSNDVLSILNHIYDKSKNELSGLTPKTEIFFLGFKKEDYQKFL